MAHRTDQTELPVQPVGQAIICNPYREPHKYWLYDTLTGEASEIAGRRPAGYWFKTERTGRGQRELFVEETREDLTLVNLLRQDVKRWRESGYRGAPKVTRDLLAHWQRADLPRPLFFCQREAVETVIYLAEIRMSGRSGRTRFHNFEVGDDDMARLLRGERPSFHEKGVYYPTLIDAAGDASLRSLIRMGCKMATGSGKTVVMAMLISWAFCNRGVNPQSREYPHAALICCPNLTIKERLQVLRPENPGSYYQEFNIVPLKYRPLLQKGKVLVENWHQMMPSSEHKEGDKTSPVIQKGPEDADAFARRVLQDLYDRMPIMVLNDEGHHCWRPAPSEDELTTEEQRDLQAEAQEATLWIQGLDRLNNASEDEPGVRICVDLSATPFYIKGSGHPEGTPFPWIVSDFGLVDAIESGIVKIPRLPVSDTTGRPDPKYFKLWEYIKGGLEPAEFLPGRARRPKPDAVYREAEGALQQLAGQWRERFEYIQNATPGQEHIPPVLIVVCDNTDLAEIFYRNISGEHEEEIATQADLAEVEEGKKKGRKKKSKKETHVVYSEGKVEPQFLSNTETVKHTIRIDTKLLAEAESEDPDKSKRTIAEELRKVVATVGKKGEPGEHVRCVVSVGMLTEGWDANNVTHILGVRAFGSQLLCEQVVGRGLRRMDYQPNADGLLPEEYVDVYGIPFSVIPYKGRPVSAPAPDDRPLNHVCSLPERADMEIRFPVVEGYAFTLKKNVITCNIDEVEQLVIEPNREPTATYLRETVGYQEGSPSQYSGPGAFVEQDRERFYHDNHIQFIKFRITRMIVEQLMSCQDSESGGAKGRVTRLQSRHQLFPQVYSIVDRYVAKRVDYQGAHPSELGLEKYVNRLVERLRDAIHPAEAAGESPLLPILNRYKPIGTTAEVDFKTVRPCHATQRSQINRVVLDTEKWERAAAFRLEQSKTVDFYARNDHLGLTIPYTYEEIDHGYEPDFVVRMKNGLTIMLETKGYEDDQTKQKHNAARRWVAAVNNWGELGAWCFHVCRNPQLLESELEVIATRKGSGLSQQSA